MGSGVSADSFYSETPPDRIIGTECEYNLQYPIDGENAADIFSYISDKVIEASGLHNCNKFLSNGAGLYVDVDHLEYDTQECLGPKQAAAADMAGVIVMRRIVTASGLPHRGLYRITGSYKPSKDAGTARGMSSGYHENYLLPRDVTHNPVIDGLLPSHLASRIWALNGTLRDQFVFSQKVWGIGGAPIAYKYERLTGHGNKPMCIIRPADDVLSDSQWARAEVRYADAGLSPLARYLSFATTSLVFRMLEHQYVFDDGRLEGLALKNPVAAAQLFAADLSLKRTAITEDGKQRTAVDIQEALAEAAADLSEEVGLPKDEDDAIDLWFYLCDKLRESNPAQGEYGVLDGILDVAAKHRYLLRHHAPADLHNRNHVAMQQSLIWDRVLPDGGGQKWWGHHTSSLIDYAEIERLTTEAPNTRSEIRAYCINEPRISLTGLNWAILNLKNGQAISLKNPYDTLRTIRA